MCVCIYLIGGFRMMLDCVVWHKVEQDNCVVFFFFYQSLFIRTPTELILCSH